ncbi:MAG TPA: NAD(P)-binding domain-containing protein, partial [Thermomicrobiales bacterium]|nr:NAD(P)-binding domain-containing protein [Thermomicrobiales bacterium]
MSEHLTIAPLRVGRTAPTYATMIGSNSHLGQGDPMATIGFIGLGNMGGPMSRNLLNAGHRLRVFDLAPAAVDRAVAAGAQPATDITDATTGTDVIITMLPAGEQVREVYLDDAGIIDTAADGTLLIDCSTIDVVTAREVSA